MHYKNGREAKEGDSVVGKAWIGSAQRVVAGTVHQLNPGAQTCNGVLTVPVVGGTTNTSVTLGEMLHAEDAFDAWVKLVETAENAPPAEDEQTA